jgi:hypothetical protein
VGIRFYTASLVSTQHFIVPVRQSKVVSQQKKVVKRRSTEQPEHNTRSRKKKKETEAPPHFLVTKNLCRISRHDHSSFIIILPCCRAFLMITDKHSILRNSPCDSNNSNKQYCAFWYSRYYHLYFGVSHYTTAKYGIFPKSSGQWLIKMEVRR